MPNTTLETVKDILSILTPVALAIIAYKQVIIGKKVDGMTSKLVDAEKGKSSAEGQLMGLEKAKQDVIDTAKVTVVVPEVQKVEVVEQAKPIVVEVKKDVKK